MNRLLRQQLVLGVLMMISCIVALYFSYSFMAAQQRAAIRAQDNLAASQQLVQRIASLKHRPALAGSRELQITELNRHIERSVRHAGIEVERSLIHIQPQAPRRFGETVYQEAPTNVLLRDVTLRELITFLHTISADETGLLVKNLRLVTPRGQDDGNHWTAELTLTYLIYAPRNGVGS